MTQYLDLESVIAQVQRLGFFVKDPGLLDSALARPRTTIFGEDAYPSLERKAAALMHSIIKNHPMVDGNKRTSWLVLNTFLFINGYFLEMTTQTAFDLTIGVATDKLDLRAASEIIARHMASIS
ncbi:type II toxin-antitoxin system death-on-curing family toxin [Aquiluna borgnonia]|uniref:Type II toxin-antitoxin system death-on-curing family toxin n=1 Tax=Aquiluna borgnonia TaxID=2499157 RepID=A0A7D4TIC6_9MICO|nr:type II toxin-antitoxin system death-on-curing family toxin [Aquiluna borgnonia]QKJ24711.1 type II toxin-antitoxin system death-on-curing family toxin [Aquiluna borgnonia]